MTLKQKVKKLLLAGNSQSAIARKLSISRTKVQKIKQEIIRDKIVWNKKQSGLECLRSFIQQCLIQELPASRIHRMVKEKNFHVSYSTVARFVSLLTGKKSRAARKMPGDEARVFFICCGKFIKNDEKVSVWVFIMRLSYSRYSFYVPTTCNTFECFMHCHVKAFNFFKGLPRSIKVNKTKAFDINEPILYKRYACFLKQSGITLVHKNKHNYCFNSTVENRQFKEHFLCHVLHRNYIRFEKELRNWYNSEVNLGIHPLTCKLIKREFLLNEKPFLISLTNTVFQN